MHRIKRRLAAASALMATLVPTGALAWGFEGHQIVADIARAELTPAVRAKVDAILMTDTDDLTGHDMAAEATWADVYRSHGGRATAQWHFVDTEIDGSADIDAACFGHPASDGAASSGPSRDCVVDKVREFAAELGDRATPPAERLLALKFLLHLVGDLHQPLHASDNHDRGGNCVLLALGGSRTQNLHAFWDTGVVEALGGDPAQVAAKLRARITPALRQQWQRGDPVSWASEAFQVARSSAYTIGSPAGCPQDPSPVSLPSDYPRRAQAAAALQLERAGVRLGTLLNRSLSNILISAAPGRTTPIPTAATPPVAGGQTNRTPESLACSAAADARSLHGKERQRFRRQCLRARTAD